MTIIYCDNKDCAFQEKDQCVRPHITLSDHAFLPPAKFLRACKSYEERISNQPLDADTKYSGDPDNNSRRDVDVFHAPML